MAGKMMKAHDIAHGMILEEICRAERLHPFWPADVIHQAAIMAEEAGEVLKAAVDYTYKDKQAQLYPSREKHVTEQLKRELIFKLIQAGAMVHRMLDNILIDEMEAK